MGREGHFDVYKCVDRDAILLRFGDDHREMFLFRTDMLREDGFFERNPKLSWMGGYLDNNFWTGNMVPLTLTTTNTNPLFETQTDWRWGTDHEH